MATDEAYEVMDEYGRAVTPEEPVEPQGKWTKKVRKQPKPETSSARDEHGVRLQQYKRFKEGRDYTAVTEREQELLELYDLARFSIQSHAKGQPPQYPTVESFVEVVNDYFDYLSDRLKIGVKLIPDVEGLAMFMGISRETLRTWTISRSPTYSATIKSATNSIMAVKKHLAQTGCIPPMVFAIDANNNHDYTQKQEVALTLQPRLSDDVQTPEAIAARYLDHVIETDAYPRITEQLPALRRNTVKTELLDDPDECDF